MYFLWVFFNNVHVDHGLQNNTNYYWLFGHGKLSTRLLENKLQNLKMLVTLASVQNCIPVNKGTVSVMYI